MSLRVGAMTMSLCVVALSCAVEHDGDPVSSSRGALTSGTVTALESVGGEKTGIHYGMEDSSTLVLTAEPVSDLVRRFAFPSVTGDFTAEITSHPPDPGLPTEQPLSVALHPPAPGESVTLTTHPPEPGKAAGDATCSFEGSGLQVRGTSEPTALGHVGAYRYDLTAENGAMTSFFRSVDGLGSDGDVQDYQEGGVTSFRSRSAGQGFTVEQTWSKPSGTKEPWTLSVKVKSPTGDVLFDSASLAAPCVPVPCDTAGGDCCQ